MQLSVLGLTARGAEATVALKPVDLDIGAQALLRGSLPLPDGLKPRQVTVQVLERPGGKQQGLRILPVR
jgi:hypothetical protein